MNEQLSKPNTEKSDSDKNVKQDFLSDVIYIILEFTIPFSIALGIWYFIIDYFKFWKLSDYIVTVIFLTLVPILSLAINMGLKSFVAMWKKIDTGEKQKSKKTKGKKILRIVLTGIIIPLVLSFAANLIPVSHDDTFLTILLHNMMFKDEYPFLKDIGDSVIEADDYDTKYGGIRTLTTIGSDGSLDEIFRIYDENYLTLNDYALYNTLTSGIASYEYSKSRDRLFEIFYQSDGFTSSVPRGATSGLHERFLEQPFVELRDEISRSTLDLTVKSEQLLLLDEFEFQLRTLLLGIENQENSTVEGDPSIDFVLDTFLAMKTLDKNDNELYFLARNIAVDPIYALGTRLKAIALVSKLGTANDFPFFVNLLSNDDERIQQAALDAISEIHIKTLKDNDENE